MGLLSPKRKRDHFTQEQHPVQNQKKKLQSSPPQCTFHRIHFKRKLSFKHKTQIIRGK